MGGYIGEKNHKEGCVCLDHFYYFGDGSSACGDCGLAIKICHYETLTPKFVERMRGHVRGMLPPQDAERLKNTFPRRFAEIVAESKKGNAAALAPHLPSVLVGIVAEYFGGS
jgi:hypothetical protein